MFKRNLWKLTLSSAIVLWAAFSLYPLSDREFPTYVQSAASARPDEFTALLAEATARHQAGESPSVFIALRDLANARDIDLTQFFPEKKLEASVRGVEKRNAILLDYLLQQSKGKLQLGLDLKGGVAFTLEVDEGAVGANVSEVEREEKLSKAIEIIGSRINGLGVAEPIIRQVGTNRIEVQLQGVNSKDNPEVVDSVKKPARLDFRLVHPTLSPNNTPEADAPAGYELMTLEGESRTGESFEQALFVKRLPEMTGDGVSDAYPVMDEFGRFKIILRFTDEGSRRFAAVTGQIAEDNRATGRIGLLAIVLDGKLYSAPSVREQINSDSAEITGSFSQREAIELANVLNNPLDLPLLVQEQYEVGPSLAADAIASGVRAAEIGIIGVILFMVIIYTVGGVVAVVSLAINLLIVLGVLASLGATISMPGIAGIVLTAGMAVDSNILIFERIREELATGKSLRAALEAGHEKVISTILDANLTTLITSSLMIAFGTGPVKGFGVTLTIGAFATMFCALIVTRTLLSMLIEGETIKKFPMLVSAKIPTFDYLKFARPAFGISWAIVAIGIGTVAYKGDRIYGIDFVGGDEVALSFDASQRVDSADLRTALENAGLGEVNPLYQSDLSGGAEVLKVQTVVDAGLRVLPVLQSAFPASNFEVLGETTIGPTIGAEIQWNALMSMAVAIVGILLYVAFRFEWGFGIGAVVSTIHDILMTIGIFVLFDRQFTAPMVAAILLVAGYSINDTIVVFDRIREELKLDPTKRLYEVINSAINKVLVRSILTTATTFIASMALFIFGGGVINDLAFTFLVGIIVGAFSSIYIAAPIFYWFHKGDRKHVEKNEDVQPTYEWTGSSKASQ